MALPFAFWKTASASAYDADAATWFAAIASAGSSITTPNKDAWNAFIVGCKADASPNGGVSNYAAMKAAVALCGVDDMTGALVPIKGSAPTNTNFLSGDYSRTAGLLGAATKQLGSNVLNNVDPQNNSSRGVYAGTVAGSAGRFMSAGTSSNCELLTGATTPAVDPRFRFGSTTIDTLTAAAGTGLIGVSRNNSANFEARAWGTQSTVTRTSGTPSATQLMVFSSGGANYMTGRIRFYWIGEAVDLALLDARLATLMAAIT